MFFNQFPHEIRDRGFMCPSVVNFGLFITLATSIICSFRELNTHLANAFHCVDIGLQIRRHLQQQERIL
jgi:hypothetical protein